MSRISEAYRLGAEAMRQAAAALCEGGCIAPDAFCHEADARKIRKLPIPAESDAVRALQKRRLAKAGGMRDPCLDVIIVPSKAKDGMLSVRLIGERDTETATSFRAALSAAGFKIGDRVRMALVPGDRKP